MKTVEFTPRGVCARRIRITLEGDTVKEVAFMGGCSGNTQGISALVKGMAVADVIERLSGIRCGFKPTSCPDQLAKALAEMTTKSENA